MNPGYIFMGTIIILLVGIITYLLLNKPKLQQVMVIEKETPKWIPWSYGWAQNPGTLVIHRPVPHFYPLAHHAGSHPAISTGFHHPKLPMIQTPVPPAPLHTFYNTSSRPTAAPQSQKM
jgi:hypothetical protein